MAVNSVINNLLEVWPDFSITPNDFLEPTSYIATQFYERFVYSLLEFPIDDIRLSIISNTPVTHDLLNYCILCTCMNIVIEKLDLQNMLQEFGLIDLLNPSSKSFKKKVTLFVQVILFGHDILENITAAQSKVVKDLAGINDLKNLSDVLNEKRNSTIITIQKILERKEIWQTDKKSLLKSIETQDEIIQQLANENKKTKNIVLAQTAEHYKLEQELLKLIALREQLEEEVMDDHESILLEKKQLEKKCEEFLLSRNDFSQVMDKRKETIKTISNIDKITTECIESINVNEILEKYALLENLENTFKKVSEELQALENTREKPQNFKKKIISFKEKKQALILKADMRVKNFDEEIAKLELEYEDAASALKKQLHLIESCDNKISRAIKCNEKYQKAIEADNSFYRQLYERILEAKSKLDNNVISLKNKTKDC